MRIAYITMQFPVPSETFASLDVETLRKHNQEVVVYCFRFKHLQYHKLMAERRHTGLSVSHFNFRSFLVSIAFILRHPAIAFSLTRWIISCCKKKPRHLLKSIFLIPSALSIFKSIYKNKPDVVHLFWGHYPSMVGYLVNKFMPTTVLSMFLGAHDLVTAYPGSLYISKKSDLLFTHSKTNLPTLAELGMDSSRFNVILRGANITPSSLSGLDKFKNLAFPVFLTAGRLIEEKGFDNVLNIFKTISISYPNAILNIAGDGPYKPALEQKVASLNLQSRVSFLGHIEQSKLILLMSKAHFFLLMSRYPSERLPNVVKEAMLQRCVVVTTNTQGIGELVESETQGFIVEKNDDQAAVASIHSCLQNQHKSLSIATSARKKIIECFDVNASMKAYTKLWQAAKCKKEKL